jgi:hypothetical protein
MNAHFSRLDFEADQVAVLRDEGRRPFAVSLKVGERLTGISESDLLRAVIRGELDGRRYNGRIVLIYSSLEHFVLGLPAQDAH